MRSRHGSSGARVDLCHGQHRLLEAGCIILMFLYLMALGVTIYYELKNARRARDSDQAMSAQLVIAVNVGAIALIFSFIPFLSQIGLQYWFFAGALHGVAYKTGLFNH